MKNRILIAITWIMVVVFIISACCLDSDTMIPFYTACGSGAWLALFAYANGLLGKVEW